MNFQKVIRRPPALGWFLGEFFVSDREVAMSEKTCFAAPLAKIMLSKNGELIDMVMVRTGDPDRYESNEDVATRILLRLKGEQHGSLD